MAAPAEDPAVEQAAVERAPGERVKMTVSMRDADSLATALRGWLAERVGASPPPELTGARMPASGGLSSTSLLFEAAWSSEGTDERGSRLSALRPARPVPADRAGEQALRGTAAPAALEPARRRTARDRVLPDGPGRRQGAARQPAVRLRRLAARCVAAGAGAARARQRQDPGRPARHHRSRRRVRMAQAAVRQGQPALACRPAIRLLPLGTGRRRRRNSDHRAEPGLAGTALAGRDRP